MIKINTQYDKELDIYTWEYLSDFSNSKEEVNETEHLVLIHKLMEIIIKNNDSLKSYKDVFNKIMEVKDIDMEEIKNDKNRNTI